MEAVAPVRIVIFAKAPVAGAVKTRLIPALGADGAARLAERMLAGTAAAAVAAGLGEPEVCAAPHPEKPEWEPFRPNGVRMTDQGEGDLGQRLARAAARVIGAGEGVLLIGTDCPDLDAARLRDAAERLRTHDAVIHPAADGGYVLLGLARFDPSLFARIAWSTSSVAADTIARVRALGWTLDIGETLRDIDEPADLQAPHASG
ncbi:MAG TPA: TIGR04282 family arsenosugar biosynthesis glycosyltransferase [Sphingomonadaceae bacterium]|nr:TIGR04282 family arsenosugar biosynthesis glycosyltransferase [Sphingomonadaceae bacterium]